MTSNEAHQVGVIIGSKVVVKITESTPAGTVLERGQPFSDLVDKIISGDRDLRRIFEEFSAEADKDVQLLMEFEAAFSDQIPSSIFGG